MLRWGVILLFLLTPNFSLASNPIHSTFFYDIFSKRIFNFDTFLVNMTGLTPVNCDYQSYVSKKKATFSGLGTCLFMSLADGVETNDIPGVINARVLTPQTHTQIPIEIVWRPDKGSWFHLFKRLYRDWQRKPQTGEKEGMLGTVIFNFPPESQKFEPEILQGLSFILPVILQSSSAADTGLSKVRVSTQPNIQDARRTDTSLLLYGQDNKVPIYHVQFSWDFYIVSPPDTVHISAKVAP